MTIEALDAHFSICQVRDFSSVDLEAPFCFAGKTDEEHSLVCLTQSVPDNALAREDGWRALRIQGALDFSLVGVLARIAALMAERGIGIFAISTFNTDYILTRQEQYPQALEALLRAGYKLV